MDEAAAMGLVPERVTADGGAQDEEQGIERRQQGIEEGQQGAGGRGGGQWPEEGVV